MIFLAPVLLNQGYHTFQHFLCESHPLWFSLAKVISPDASTYFTTLYHTLSSLQHQLSLSSTNLSSPSNIVSTQLEHSISLSNLIVHNRILPTVSSQLDSFTLTHHIVQNSIVPIGQHISLNIVSLSNINVPNNIVLNSIMPIYNHIPHHIVFNSNISLSKTYLTLLLQHRFDILMGLILLIIPIFIVIYSNVSFILFH